jgi:RNA polymerase sigma-70 factor (family 1)
MTDLEKAGEKQILISLADGNEAAFRLIFSKYVDRIHQTALYYLRSDALAEEVVQDIFMRVWLKKEELRQVHHFEGWLFIMSKNYLLNYLEKLAVERKALHSLGRSLPRAEETTDFRVADHQYENLLHKAIISLSPMQKDVYRMAREEQLSYEQIGQKLGISSLTVKTHMGRALRHIRQFFRAYGETLKLLIILITQITQILFLS